MEQPTITPGELSQFTGTEHYYRVSPIHGNLVLTDGVKYLCERAQCYWLVDIVASYQYKLTSEPFQVWTLGIDADEMRGSVRCEDGNGNILVRQELEYTDFPIETGITLFLEEGGIGPLGPVYMVLMLTSER